jgi:hypothetical protein
MTGQLVLTPPKCGQRIHRPVVTRAASVVLALDDVAQARAIRDAFRLDGWEVYLAAGDLDARRLVHQLRPTAAILATDPAKGESGWLTCKKLVMDRPALRVILVSPNPTDRERRLAEFVGAAALVATSATCRLVGAASGFDVPTAN